MRRTAVRALVAATASALAVLSAGPASATDTVVLDGVRVVLDDGTTQVVTVRHASGWHARVVLWQRTSVGWRAATRTTDGRTGYGGLVLGSQRRQGTGTTPLGSYRLLSGFGTHPKSTSWDFGYHQVHSGDYWVDDNSSAYYNRLRNKRLGGFRWWLTSGADESERLTDFPTQYEYAINTSFNYSQVRHRGSGIFLHVNGRAATVGCVSVPRWFMQSAMARLDADQVPMIAIGR